MVQANRVRAVPHRHEITFDLSLISVFSSLFPPLSIVVLLIRGITTRADIHKNQLSRSRIINRLVGSVRDIAPRLSLSLQC